MLRKFFGFVTGSNAPEYGAAEFLDKVQHGDLNVDEIIAHEDAQNAHHAQSADVRPRPSNS